MFREGTFMTDLLLKIFVKDSDNISDVKVREKYGALSGCVGICINIILFLIKLLAGIITASISIMADAFNNLSDAGSSIVTLIGFKMAGKPADNDHPYGHGRVEYITGLIIAFVILVMGFELLKSSIEKIIEPEDIEFSFVSFGILVFSIFAKLWLAIFNKSLGKKINSSAMFATASDSLNDSIATTVVLIGLLIVKFFGINIDGYAGVIVAVFVLYSGYETAKDTLQPLLGMPPDPNFVKDIQNCVLENEKIHGIHDMIIHDYGPSRTIVSLHAEIPSDINLIEAHEIIDEAEERIKRKFDCDISIHLDPIVLNDEFHNEVKEKVQGIIKEISPDLEFHDFRVIRKVVQTKIVFDVEIPFTFEMSDDEVVREIKSKIKDIDESYYPVINVDKKSI